MLENQLKQTKPKRRNIVPHIPREFLCTIHAQSLQIVSQPLILLLKHWGRNKPKIIAAWNELSKEV